MYKYGLVEALLALAVVDAGSFGLIVNESIKTLVCNMIRYESYYDCMRYFTINSPAVTTSRCYCRQQ